jgi:hypothetical protein
MQTSFDVVWITFWASIAAASTDGRTDDATARGEESAIRVEEKCTTENEKSTETNVRNFSY